MRLLDIFKRKHQAQREADEQKLQALPIEINAPTDVALNRMAGRLFNLYQVDIPTAETLQAIENYKAGIAKYGHTPPTNSDEAEAFIAKLKE